ncbi:hypothetical protein R3W88_029353 [Solanum pinnatisectum]|uniref:Uncharacterized protein n=1 Tax=Solanum pinnatisectum TaxID=50273 RepID=A0AAV9K547_9SOLN|nr:hypothetical protein R3W88_029353 [Solanum pinnatisectum]
MADRIVIDLVEDELNCEEVESYQDKIAKLEGKVAKMEQEIDGIKEMIADLKNSSYENSLHYDLRGSSDKDLEGYNEFNMILFARTLTEPTLMWYANQDTRKWFSWVDMAKDFTKQYRPPNSAYKGCDLLKRKSVESFVGTKGHESQKKVAE